MDILYIVGVKTKLDKPPAGKIKIGMKSLSEAELRGIIEPRLSKYFHLHAEQKGYLNGSLKRIDLIIQNKVDPELVFGIEFKDNQKKRGYKIGRWCRQMMAYSSIKWDHANNTIKTGYIPIIACPSISGTYFDYTYPGAFQHPENHDHNNVNSFLSEALNIGEIRPVVFREQGEWLLRICFANKVLWREFDTRYETQFSDILTYRDIVKEEYRHPFNYKKILENSQKYREEIKVG